MHIIVDIMAKAIHDSSEKFGFKFNTMKENVHPAFVVLDVTMTSCIYKYIKHYA